MLRLKDLYKKSVYMQILRLYVTGYKNLVDCEIKPNGIHALTGRNSLGKSNLLEVLMFVADLQTASLTSEPLYISGLCQNATRWTPLKSGETLGFRFDLECIMPVAGKKWHVRYSLQFSEPEYKKRGVMLQSPVYIKHESLEAKIAKKPGKFKRLLNRNESGLTSVWSENGRAIHRFSTRKSMSSLVVLAVREGEAFERSFSVISSFRESLMNTHLIKLDVENLSRILFRSDKKEDFVDRPGQPVSSFNLYSVIEKIKSDDKKWTEFIHWTNSIAGIEEIALFEYKVPDSEETMHFVWPRQHGRDLYNGELSTGATAVLAVSIAIFSFLDKPGVLLLEEPENNLHPGAVIELVRFLRSICQDRTVIFSTHSPVALNSLLPEEVTVLRGLGNGYSTTKSVSDIPQVIRSLERGFMSFGDLLQESFSED